MISSKKLGRTVTADVDKALANIGASTPKPDMKADDELKKAAGPSRNLTRGEAFRLARMKAKLEGKDPSKQTFTYEGKTYHTRMAGEGTNAATSKAAAPKAANTPAAKSGVKPETEKFVNNLRSAMYLNGKDVAFISDKVKPSKRSDYIPVWSLKSKSDKPAASPAKPRTSKDRSAEARGRVVDAVKGFFGASDESRTRYAAQQKKAAEMRAARKPLLLTGEEARKANKGTIGGKAKGGKIDGCAVRGKTRAGRK